MKSKKHQEIPREEFSVEFGDVNGVKLYEILQPAKQKKESSKKENNEK
jgi:hypothetical protein